ncbi:MAG: SDR family NAD(P)-dependent oxidoreductase [Beijerinckiaceae bacterium]
MAEYVLVTGGKGGIGSAVADRFLNAGFNVISFDIDDSPDVQRHSSKAGTFVNYKVDVRDFSEMPAAIKLISTHTNDLKHFISLAGGARVEEFGGLSNMDVDIIQDSVKVNLESHIVLSRLLDPILRESQCADKSITFISSINAIMDFGLPAYSAAKAGLLGFMRVLAAELGTSGVRVNSILPGTVITRKPRDEPKVLDKYLQGTLLNRFATAEDIAEVTFCLAEQMTCITGQTIIADCGQTVRGRYENI